MSQDSKERFTKHVDNYVKYRPGYPAQALDCLLRECDLAQGSIVADIGAGTGKFTRSLLERGLTVYAVEPNDAMRAAMETALSGFGGFHAIKAAAEETGLPDAFVDAVTAAQAFHWFDRPRFKAECGRILKPGGKVALVWNRRDIDAPVMVAYEAVLQACHDDMPNKTMRDIGEEVYGSFFEQYAVHRIASYQQLDYGGLVGRALSSSYAPLPGHPQYKPLRAALRGLFEKYQQDGQVIFTYRTEVVIGHA